MARQRNQGNPPLGDAGTRSAHESIEQLPAARALKKKFIKRGARYIFVYHIRYVQQLPSALRCSRVFFKRHARAHAHSTHPDSKHGTEARAGDTPGQRDAAMLLYA